MTEHQRLANDRYNTPQELCDRLVRDLVADGFLTRDENEDAIVLEPSAGSGNFVRALRENAPGWIVHANDICDDGEALTAAGAHATIQKDFLDFKGCRYDAIVGNPPYARDTGRRNKKGKPILESVVELHVRHALSLLRPGGVLAFLLRLAVLESAERFSLWQQHPPALVRVLETRPAFVGGTTDATAYAFFVWRRGFRGRSALEVVSWK